LTKSVKLKYEAQQSLGQEKVFRLYLEKLIYATLFCKALFSSSFLVIFNFVVELSLAYFCTTFLFWVELSLTLSAYSIILFLSSAWHIFYNFLFWVELSLSLSGYSIILLLSSAWQIFLYNFLFWVELSFFLSGYSIRIKNWTWHKEKTNENLTKKVDNLTKKLKTRQKV